MLGLIAGRDERAGAAALCSVKLNKGEAIILSRVPCSSPRQMTFLLNQR
jgi:hypothetical protein